MTVPTTDFSKVPARRLMVGDVEIRPDNPFLPAVGSPGSPRKDEPALLPAPVIAPSTNGTPKKWQVRSPTHARASNDYPVTPFTDPRSPQTKRVQRQHSSPPRVQQNVRSSERKEATGNSSNSSNSSKRARDSPYKGIPEKSPANAQARRSEKSQMPSEKSAERFWFLKPGEVARQWQAAGKTVATHDMLVDFHLGMRAQFEALGWDEQSIAKSVAYNAGLKLLAPLVRNGPLNRDEFFERLTEAIPHLTIAQKEVLPELLDIMRAKTSVSGKDKVFFHPSAKVFALADSLVRQQELPEAERAAQTKTIRKTIKPLVSELWPKRRKSMGAMMRSRDTGVAEKPEPSTLRPASPRVTKGHRDD
jgi:hypothetical protein